MFVVECCSVVVWCCGVSLYHWCCLCVPRVFFLSVVDGGVWCLLRVRFSDCVAVLVVTGVGGIVGGGVVVDGVVVLEVVGVVGV